jgi:predicted transcriptional regulator of viral defense system
MKKTLNEKELFRIAAAQGGYFTAGQAEKAGYSGKNHHFHLRSGSWIREWRGIYRLSRFPLPADAQYSLWGVWSGGRDGEPRGVYSHETALALFGLSDIQPAKLHMTVPRGYRRHGRIPEALVLHHAPIKTDECEERPGYRVSRPFKTFVDLVRAQSVSPEFIKQAVRQALDNGTLTREQYRKLEALPRVGPAFRRIMAGT